MLYEVNLLPWREERRKKRKQSFIFMIFLACGISLFALLLMGLYLDDQVKYQWQRLAQLDGYIAGLENELTQLSLIEDEVQELITKLMYVDEKQRERNTTTILINQLPILMPDGVYIDKMIRQGSEIEIFGISEDSQQLEQLLNRFEYSPLFSNVQFKFIGSGKKRFKQNFQIFTLSLNINMAVPLIEPDRRY